MHNIFKTLALILALPLLAAVSTDVRAQTWIQLGSDIDGTTAEEYSGASVSLSSDGTRLAVGAAVPTGGTGANFGAPGHTSVYEWSGTAWIQLGDDIEGEANQDRSGHSVSLSGDGTRLAISAPDNDGAGDKAGHTRVYEYSGSAWVQLGADIDGEAAGDLSGYSISLSSDGARLAVGSRYNKGGTAYRAGHTRVYEWNTTTQAWVKLGADIDGEAITDYSGWSVSLSSDGARLAIGAPWNDGAGSLAGHTRVYEWNTTTQAWVKLGGDIDGEAAGDESGSSVSLSSDGTRLAVGAPYNNGAKGHTRVYEWNATTQAWVQLGSDIDGEAAVDYFGWSVSLSSDGARLAVGTPYNDGAGDRAGHTRIYQWSGSAWVQIGTDIDGVTAGEDSGWSVSLSGDGTRLAVGAPANNEAGTNAGQTRAYTLQLPSQATLVASASPTSINVGQTSALSTTGGSGEGTVTYAVASGSCSISGSTLSGNGAGTCSVTATKAADSSYAAITSAAIDVTVNLAPQTTLVVAADPVSIDVGQTSTLSTTGGSGEGTVTYAVASGPCSISDNTLTGNGASTCSVTATKAADSTYAAITSAAIDVTVSLAPQTTLVVAADPASIDVGQTSTLSTTGGSGTGAVTYAVAAGPCSIAGSTLTGNGAGTCSVTATKAADSIYAATISAGIDVTVSLAPQTTLVVAADPASIDVGQTSALSTTGGSGEGTVTYAVASGPCSIAGSTLTGNGAGTCSVTATKAADSTYAATTSAAIDVTVNLAPQTTLVVAADPASIDVGQTSALSTTGGSGEGTVTYEVASGPCSIAGSTLTGNGAGTCSVTATKAADSTYAATTSAAIDVTVNLAPQTTLVVAADPASIDVGQTSALSTTGGSGEGTVTYAVAAGPCSIAGSTLTGNGAGTCSVTATKAADSTYAATTSATIDVTVGLASQTALVALANPTSIDVGQTSTLSTTGGSGTGTVTYAVATGPCSITGSTLTGNGAGSCSVTATKAADSTYAAITSAAINITVNQAPQVLTLSGEGGSSVTIPTGSGSLVAFSKITNPTPPSGVLVGDQIGTYSFTANGVSGSITIAIDVGAPIPAGTKIYKVNGSTWTEITTATFSGNTVTYTVNDNDAILDLDPTVGTIRDPVALISSPAVASGPATPVPTLPLTAISLLCGLAGLLGMRQLSKAT